MLEPQMLEIIRTAALSDGEAHTYLPATESEAAHFQPHDWVLNAGKEIAAQAIMSFVNSQIGAFEAGFVDDNKVSLSGLYRYAQHHVKDNYGVDTKLLNEAWGDEIAAVCRAEDHGK